MPEEEVNNTDKKQKNSTLSPNSHIVFTIKGFIATIMTILGLFVGFYKLAIQPAMVSSEIHYQEMLKTQKEFINKEFEHLEEKVDRNADLIEKNHERFRDLEAPNNSGGELGVENISTSNVTDSLTVDNSLANLHD